jgi:hypothetical protein
VSISGIQGSTGIDSVNSNPASNGAQRADDFLSALRKIDPKLADQLSAQIDSLRSSNASPAQIGQALRATIAQLSPSQQSEVEQAFASVRGHHHHHHRHGGAGASSGMTQPTSAIGAGAPDSDPLTAPDTSLSSAPTLDVQA